MLLSCIVFGVVGWLVGVHSPWWLVFIIVSAVIYFTHKEEGLGGIAVLLGIALPFSVGSLLGGIIYGDLSLSWIDLSLLFTGK